MPSGAHIENVACVVLVLVLAFAVSVYTVSFIRKSAKAYASVARNDGDQRADEIAERDRDASGRASCSRRQGGCASQNSNPGLVETNSAGGAAPGLVVRAGGPGVPGRGRSGAAATWTQRPVAHRTRWHCEPEELGGPCRGNLDGMKARRPRGDADFTSDDGVFAEAAGDTLYQMHPAGCTKPDSRHLNAVTSLGDWVVS